MAGKPRGYLEQLLGENERVMLVARRHWLVLVGEILTEAVLAVALAVLVSLIWALWVPDARVALAYLLLAFPLIGLTRDVLIWANRLYVVTNRRVIQVHGVLEKEVTDSSLEKVNDVKMKQSVWGRLLGYGDIEILTASELGVNKFTRLADPMAFKTAMLNAKEAMEYGASRPAPAPAASPKPAAPAGPSVVELLQQLDALRQHGVLTEAEFQNKKKELMERL